jgi:hypothetical protein
MTPLQLGILIVSGSLGAALGMWLTRRSRNSTK